MNQVKSFFSGAEQPRDGFSSSSSSSFELSKQERERLHRRFDRLTRNTGLLTLADLSALPELQNNPYVPLIFGFLCREAGRKEGAGAESGGLGVVEFGRALESLDHGGGAGGGEGKLAAAVFRVLDANCDGKLSVDELEAGLRPVLSAKRASENNRNSEGVPPALVARAALCKHDGDGDGKLVLSEFRSLLAAAGGR